MAQTSPDCHLILSKARQSMKSKTFELIDNLERTKDFNISLNEKAIWRVTILGNQQNNYMCHKSLKGIIQDIHWRG
jgi:hypothetical protein